VICTAQESLKFNHITIVDGLSQSSVRVIFQDRYGFMWFGTNDGLNKYDGYSFTIYRNDLDDKHSLSNNEITSIIEDEGGSLWIGTSGGGLNHFDRSSERFMVYKHTGSTINGLSSDYITSLYVDSADRLWVGTENGLDRLDASLKEFKHYDVESGHLISNSVLSIAGDGKETVWIGTYGGLSKINLKKGTVVHSITDEESMSGLDGPPINSRYYSKSGDLWVGCFDDYLTKYDEKLDSFIHYKFARPPEMNLSRWGWGDIKSICEDFEGNIWIASLWNGLGKFNVKDKTFSRYLHNPLISSSLSYNVLFSVYVDRSNLLWVGTFGTGLNTHSLNTKSFNLFRSEPYNVNSLSNSSLREIYEDDEGVLWIGSYGGLNSYDKNTKSFKKYKGGSENVYSIIPNSEDDNFLWIGTEGQGLYRFNKSTETFKLMDSEDYNRSLILSMVDDKKGSLWMAINDGLLQYEIAKKKYTKFDLFKEERQNDQFVTVVYIDRSGVLWLGSTFGLIKFSTKSYAFKRYVHNELNSSSISNNNVKSVYEDEFGYLWVGTNGGGLNRLDRESGEFVHYDKTDGLPNNVIYGILEDQENNLWLSSNYGLSKFNPKTLEVVNFTTEDGLQSNEFNTNSFFKSKSGEMFFGGIKGLSSFYPNQIKTLTYDPPVVITSFKKFDEKVRFDQGISRVERINLKYNEDFVSFEFAALDYTAAQKNKYAYKLDGFDKNWIDAGARRYASYTNLEGGEYTFKVKGTNSSGVWSASEASVILNVQSPFWKMPWFFVLVGLLVSTIVFGGFRIRLNRVKLEARKEYFKKQNDEKITMMKEIHHRVKNNLQIVNSLLRFQSYQVQDEKIVAMFEASQDRVLSMARLHEQLYQSEDLKHVDIKSHFTSLIEGLIHEYQVGIDISLDINVEPVDIGVKTLVPLGLLINELITNSLKHAFKGGEGGEILVHLRCLEGVKYELVIGDDGVGLIPNDKDKGLGTELIEIFTEQLEASIERLEQPGTVFKIIFEKIDKE